MLKKIRAYIKKNRLVSIEQLQREFVMCQSALEPILHLLMLRKEIIKLDADMCGKHCQDCHTAHYYEWL